MASFPVPLDNLIAYVRAQQPNGLPLDELAEAAKLAARVDEQADALLGHFVDQARRSGASWSQIGASIGVSKQAAQQRFVPRWDADAGSGRQPFSRFTPRARNVLAAAQAISGECVSAAAVVVGLLSEPEALAVTVLHELGVGDRDLCEKLGLAPATTVPDSDPGALRELCFTPDGEALLNGTLAAVLRLGHNYVGTEHLLLGALVADGETAERLRGLGLDPESVEAHVTAHLERILAAVRGSTETGR